MTCTLQTGQRRHVVYSIPCKYILKRHSLPHCQPFKPPSESLVLEAVLHSLTLLIAVRPLLTVSHGFLLTSVMDASCHFWYQWFMYTFLIGRISLSGMDPASPSLPSSQHKWHNVSRYSSSEVVHHVLLQPHNPRHSVCTLRRRDNGRDRDHGGGCLWTKRWVPALIVRHNAIEQHR